MNLTIKLLDRCDREAFQAVVSSCNDECATGPVFDVFMACYRDPSLTRHVELGNARWNVMNERRRPWL
jgi:hypothetical protein